MPDHDAIGCRHAAAVGAALAGVASEVRWLELPGLPDKGDVSDWIAGRQREGAAAGDIGGDLLQLATAAPPAAERAALEASGAAAATGPLVSG